MLNTLSSLYMTTVGEGSREEVFSGAMLVVGLIIAVGVAFFLFIFVYDFIEYSAEQNERFWRKTQKERLDKHGVKDKIFESFSAAANLEERLNVILPISTEKEVKNKKFMRLYYETVMKMVSDRKKADAWIKYFRGDVKVLDIPDDVSIDSVYASMEPEWKKIHEEQTIAEEEYHRRHEMFMERAYASHRSGAAKSRKAQKGKRSTDSGSGSSSRSSSSRSSSGSSSSAAAAAIAVFASDSGSSTSYSDGGSNFSGGGDSGSY
jgi:hypothetical protein